MPEPDFIRLQRRFAAHLRDPGLHPAPAGIEDRRLAIYRDLFFNNVVGLLAGNFPVLRSLHDESGWQQFVRAWYRDHRAHTPLFPELGRELVRWLQARAETSASDPPWFAELAHYEWMEVVAANHEADIGQIEHDRDGDLMRRTPVVSPLVWPLVYRWPVHRISASHRPGDGIPEQPTCLIIVRNRDDRVGFLEANPLTLRLLERLQQESGPCGREVLASLATDIGIEAEALIAAGERILHQLRDRDIVLGSRD